MKKEEILESLSPNERVILPLLYERDVEKISKKSHLDKTSTLRALEFLANKNIITLRIEKKKIVELGTNGIQYRKTGLPERKLLDALSEKPILSLQDAKKTSHLTDNEFKAALGALKKKAFVELKNGKLMLTANKEEITKKSLEEHFLEALPLNYEELKLEQQFALKNLLSRKDIVKIEEKKNILFSITDFGKEIMSLSQIEGVKKELIEQLTPAMIESEAWKGKKFRRYDIISPVPKIYGGKRHFVNQAIDYARKVWTEMGFKEMTGTLTQTGFWNFDALFTAQDHPVRELQDTFYIKGTGGKLPDKKIVNAVKQAHETGTTGSKGWQYSWKEDEAKKVILRTHTTCLSAQTLAKLKKSDLSAKFFAVGKCFRNETIDWSHGFEFNQTEGIVIDENANFRNLLGYLKEFFRKMGFEKIRFTPAYFPYTEPSVEINWFHPEKKIWLELGGAGIFRPEVVIPLFGEYVPVLAWGPGFDRTIMDYYEIKDLREMQKNDLTQLRKIKFWIK